MLKVLLFLILLFPLCAIAENGKKRYLNVYNWAEYIAPEILTLFKKETGIEVKYDVFDSNNILESKITLGKSGYDIVFPSAFPFWTRQVKMRLYQKIDTTRLKNYHNLDPFILSVLARHDKNNEYGVPYMLDTLGIGYNILEAEKRFPGEEINSLEFFFDKKKVAKFSDCGVEVLDSPDEIYPLTMLFLGLDPSSNTKEALDKAQKLLLSIRPYISNINSLTYGDDIANGDACLVLGHSTNLTQAMFKTKYADGRNKLGYAIPVEGSEVGLDVMAIPKGAKNIDEAYEFIDFLLRPEIIAKISNHIGSTNPNIGSLKYIKDELKNNKNIFVDEEMKKRLYFLGLQPLSYNRMKMISWMEFLSHKHK
jgi:putrescine transport system substrate-binding protein